MSGALIQLAARGAPDTHISFQPQKTYFKSCHKRHTNFAVERLQGQFSGQIRLGGRLLHRVQRSADLLGRTYVVLEFNKLIDTRGAFVGDLTIGGVATNYYATEGAAVLAANVRNNPIYSLGDGIRFVDAMPLLALQESTIKIGGHQIDSYSGFCGVMEEDLYTQERNRYQGLVGIYPSDSDAITAAGQYNNTGAAGNPALTNINGIGVAGATVTQTVRYYVPLQFWFSGALKSNAIPLIGLQYHDITLEFRIARGEELVKFVYNQDAGGLRNINGNSPDNAANQNAITGLNWTGGELADAFLISDGVFLDTKERKMFSCTCGEYLILQHQGQDFSVPAGSASYSIQVQANLPCTHMMYFLRRYENELLSDWTDFTGFTAESRAVDVVATHAYQFNGQNIDQPLDSVWCRLVEPGDHGAYKPDLFFYTKPFALNINPEWGRGAANSMQGITDPSGTADLSRIDRFNLLLTADGVTNSNQTPAIPATAVAGAAITQDLQGHICLRNWNIGKVAAGMFGLYYSN